MSRSKPPGLRRHLRADFTRDDAVSEVLGNVIMIAITVSMLGSFGLLVFDSVNNQTTTAPAASFTMVPVLGSTSVDVRLVSGTSLVLSETTLILTVNGTYEIANAAVLSPSVAGEWGVGETLRVDMIAATLAEGDALVFFVADVFSGKTVGTAYAQVPSATSGTPILQNALTLSLAFDRSPLVADGLTSANATLEVTTTHGLLLIDHVSLNLSPVGGVSDLRLYDDGNEPDVDAGDGIFTAPFAVADHAFTSLPGYDNVTLSASVVDVLGTTTPDTAVLYLMTPTAGHVGAGVVYRDIGTSGEIADEGYINLSAFAFRDASAVDSDQVELRVSDLDDSTKVWSALVSFATTGCTGPAVTSVVLRIDGVAGNVTYAPASGCFLIDADARLNLANLDTSLDAAGSTITWTAVATSNPEASFQYSAAGVGASNEALISFFGDTISSSPFARGLSQTDFSWAPPPAAAPPAEPAAITTLAATAGNALVDLTWTSPASGGSSITGYNVYRDGVLIASIAPGTSYQATGLTNGVLYTFNVRAVNAIGEAAASNNATATPRTTPGAPTGLGGTAQNMSAALSWTAGSTGGSAITNYHVYAGTTSGATTYLASTGGANTSFTANGLTNGVTYYFNVTAQNAVGQGASSVQTAVTPSTLPYPPDALAATGGNNRVTLSWTPGNDGGLALTNYHVYRGTTSGATTFLASTGIGTNTSFIDLTAQNGITYYYNLTARNANGAGATSNEASATPAPTTTTPSVPLSLGATGANHSVALSWSAPASDGGSPITNYKVYAGTASGATTFVGTTGGANTSFTVDGLTNGVLHFFNVTAVNAIGEGNSSAEASATPIGVPYPPTSLVATRGNQSATLTWTAPTTTGGAPITNYHVYAGSSSGATTYLGATGGSNTSFVVNGLTNGATAYFNVTAANAAGQGGSSNEASAVPATIPNPPATLAATTGDGTVTLTWTIPANGGSAITNFKIYRGTTSGAATFLGLAGSGANTSFMVNGLTNGIPYFFNVTAVNDVGESATSNEATATPAGLPGAPQSLSATKGNGTVSLSWSAPSSNGGSAITNYHVYRGTTSGATTFLAALGGTNTSFVANGLTNGVAHFFNVTAVNAIGQGASSNEATATPSTVPLPPTGLAATNGNTTASLSWTAPSLNGGSAITDYYVYRGTTSGATTFLGSVGSATTSYLATGLTNGVAYFFNVTAVNANGQSATSNEASVTPITVPNPAATFTATGGVGQIDLAWTAGSTGGSAITGYQIWRATSTGAQTLLASVGTNTSYADLAVSPGTTYYYYIRAVNAAGSSNPSVERTGVATAHTYASTTTTSITGGTITNAANFARDNAGDVATFTEAGTTTITSYPPSANDRHFNTTPNTWALTGSSNVALTFPTTGGNPGGAMLVRSTSGTWSATIENSFTIATAASTAATFSVDSYTTGGGTITFTLVKPGGATVTLGTNSAGTYTTTTATVAASDLATTGTYILRVGIAGSGNNKDTYVDNVYLNVPTASDNQFGHEFTVSGIPAGATYTLEVRARQVMAAEDLAIRTPAGATLATISSTTMTTYSVTVTPTGGTYVVRLIDVTPSSDPTASTWEIDYIRVVTS